MFSIYVLIIKSQQQKKLTDKNNIHPEKALKGKILYI